MQPAAQTPGRMPTRLERPRQHRHQPQPQIELAPAMVRDIYAIDPVIDRYLGVLGGGDALEDQRDVEIPLDPLDVLPVELRLIDPRIIDPHAAALVTLGNVAPAAAVAVGALLHAEGTCAPLRGAADTVDAPR